jgi:hypothetical protein
MDDVVVAVLGFVERAICGVDQSFDSVSVAECRCTGEGHAQLQRRGPNLEVLS